MDTGMIILSDKWYGRLKWLVAIVLPAISALYFGLAQIYEWGNGEQVVGTLALLTTFLGTILGVTSRQYNKNNMGDGQIVVSSADDVTSMSLQLEKTPEELAAMKRVSFKVLNHEA